MTIDNLDQQVTQIDRLEKESKNRELNKHFDSMFEAKNGFFENLTSSADKNITGWLGISGVELVSENRVLAYKTVKNMFTGSENTLGINDIAKRKVNPEYKYQNIKQQAGFAAEMISTAKENLLALDNKTGVETYRTDDLAVLKPELGFKKNDPYVDKVRWDADGNILERIQTKFVGRSSEECLSKLSSKKFEKYLDGTKVDKIEIPSDYYDKIKNELLPDKIKSLDNQIAKAEELGKVDVVETKKAELNKYKIIDSKIEKSLVSNQEAQNAVTHPKIYKAKMMAPEIAKAGHETGVKAGKNAATLTFAISTVDNVTDYFNGEVELDDAVANIVTETGTSALMGYGTGFATSALQTVMSNSSKALIRSVGNSCLPAAAVSFTVESYDEVSAYIKGEIDEYELAEGLGDSAAKVAGGLAGATAGATIGSVVPVVGTAIGGVVGGMVGCALASEGYNLSVDYLKEHKDEIIDTAQKGVDTVVNTVIDGAEVVSQKAGELANTAQELASGVISNVSEIAPDVVSDVKDAFSDFASNVKLPFSLG